MLIAGSGTVVRTSRASGAAEALVSSINTAYDDARDAHLAYYAAKRSGASLATLTPLNATKDATYAALAALQQDYVDEICAELRTWLEANLP